MTHALYVIFLAIIFYRIGVIAAHHGIARECKRLGGFFVDNETFKCTEIIKEVSK